MESTIICRERVYQQWGRVSRLREQPVTIRLAVHAASDQGRNPSAYYLVVTGFFKLLQDLDVISYRHTVTEEGLVFYLKVRESRNVVRSYLASLRKKHILASAWEIHLVESARYVAFPYDTPLLTEQEIQSLTSLHISMGSRPLRFSKMFLYAALSAFGREHGYGSCVFDRADAREGTDFYTILQGMEILQHAFTDVDFSRASSLQQLREMAKPAEAALYRVGGERFFKEIFFQSMLLACAYEKKIPFDFVCPVIGTMTQEMEKGFSGADFSDGCESYWSSGSDSIRKVVIQGFQPLVEIAVPFFQKQKDSDDRTLFLMTQWEDTTTIADLTRARYRELQRVAEMALKSRAVDRKQFNELFYRNGLVCNGLQELYIVTEILLWMEREE